MSYRNTSERYGVIARTLHWLTAALFLFSYASVYYRHWFTEAKTDANWNALQIHLSLGVSIGVVVALRIIWRFMNTQPKPEPGSRLEHLAAKLGHLALYAVMIIMPVTGYLGTGANTEFFFLFEIPKFADTAAFQFLLDKQYVSSFKAIEAPIDFIHKDIMGAWLVWILIAGHAAAALFHHYVKKDRTLVRMAKG